MNTDDNEGENIIWRDTEYARPHNAFSSTKSLAERAKTFNWKKQITESFFKFKLKEYPVAEPIKQIAIDFSFPSYKVEWKYNSEENNYQRYLAGVEQKGITAKNIIIQMLSNQLIQDDEKGRLNMPVVGKGAIFYYLDGEEKQGTWEKDDYENKTIFLNEEQKEIRLNKGVTWIEVVDYAWKIEVK